MGVIGQNQMRRRGRGLDQPAAVAVDFDPRDHTIAEVLDYVGEHPGERAYLRQAEAEGKARVSLLTALAD